MRSTCARTRSVRLRLAALASAGSSVSAQSTGAIATAYSRDGGANEIERSSRSTAPRRSAVADRVLHRRRRPVRRAAAARRSWWGGRSDRPRRAARRRYSTPNGCRPTIANVRYAAAHAPLTQRAAQQPPVHEQDLVAAIGTVVAGRAHPAADRGVALVARARATIEPRRSAEDVTQARREIVAGRNANAVLPSCSSVKPTCGYASASVASHDEMRANSAAGGRRYSRRTGTLANRSRTTTRVPGGPASGRGVADLVAVRIDRGRDLGAARCARRSSRFATAAIDASPSPRKPSVSTRASSEASAIFEVAWRVSASGEIVRRDPAAVVGDLDLGQPAAAHANGDPRAHRRRARSRPAPSPPRAAVRSPRRRRSARSSRHPAAGSPRPLQRRADDLRASASCSSRNAADLDPVPREAAPARLGLHGAVRVAPITARPWAADDEHLGRDESTTQSSSIPAAEYVAPSARGRRARDVSATSTSSRRSAGPGSVSGTASLRPFRIDRRRAVVRISVQRERRVRSDDLRATPAPASQI